MNLIRLLLRSAWPTVTLAVLTGLLSGASSARLIALINEALNRQASATQLAWSFTGLGFVILLTSVTSQILLIRLSQKAIFDLRMLLSCRILASPLPALEQLGTPRLLATLTNDVESVSHAVFLLPFLCIDIAIVVGCQLYLGWLSPPMFVVTLSFMGLGIISYQLLSARAWPFLKRAREEQDRLFKHFRALTEGAKELKLHRERRHAFLSHDLQSTAAASQYQNVVGLSIFATAASWGQLCFFIIVGLLLFALPQLINITPAILSGYVLTVIYLMTPLSNILRLLPSLTRAGVALQKVESLGLTLATQSSEPDLITTQSAAPSWKRLELVGATHTYHREPEDSSFILGPIDLTIHAGELMFLVGGNGSGKSTLAKLITGLYIPESGKICLDGQPITAETREWYRQQFSVVFSDFYLFESLLGLGSLNIDTQAQKYLKQLQLDHKVQVATGVLSTTALSQGQRKRLALLTAFLEDRPIYLFDEWASDQDPVFKEIFYTQILPALKNRGKTILVISHDERYFNLAERLVKLNHGQLAYDKHT
ncbi:MAG TPA: cyclic peptide export ABC transporter [Candidatus Caenarcaniphilales bacterium]